MVVKSKSPRETRELAIKIARRVVVKHGVKQAVVLALEGELGAGKTVFVQGFVKALGIKHKITSPTFVFMKPYPSAKLMAGKDCTLYHIDSYRLKDHRDLEALGVRELIKDPRNILLIEWSDRVSRILPKKYIKIHIDHIDKITRKISITEK